MERCGVFESSEFVVIVIDAIRYGLARRQAQKYRRDGWKRGLVLGRIESVTGTWEMRRVRAIRCWHNTGVTWHGMEMHGIGN